MNGDIKMYGSYLHGIRSHSSDLDITFLVDDHRHLGPHEILARFKPEFEKRFDSVVQIFRNQRMPLLKAVDRQTQLEIDFCVNNHLAIQKSELLRDYCRFD